MKPSHRDVAQHAKLVQKSTGARQPARHGAILLCVLVCMLVAGSLLATTTLSVLRSRQEAKAYRLNVQALQLLDAGVQRALAGAAESGTDYEGEEWTLDSSEIPIPQTNQAVITITIEKQESDNPANATATVSVRIKESAESNDNQPAIRLKRSLVIPIGLNPNTSSSENEDPDSNTGLA